MNDFSRCNGFGGRRKVEAEPQITFREALGVGTWEGEICPLGSPRQKFHPQSILSESLICGLDVTILRWKHSSSGPSTFKTSLSSSTCMMLVGGLKKEGSTSVISKVVRIPVAFILMSLCPINFAACWNRWRSWQLRRKQKTLSCRAATSPGDKRKLRRGKQEANYQVWTMGTTRGTVTNSIIYWVDNSCVCFVTGTCSRCVYLMLYLASERAWQHLALAIINIMPSFKSPCWLS